ncbi:hypothetical protein QTO34_004994 [Cnephaeus nilssonii]|uniref:BRD3 opposite strand n=1 Tax=Cnephaeus nilssonii TaxID=3371016 RepID=A0AA40HNR2_CNENI|nr:hypothetical protein QTO34_004994 [Eptesicus nilssonii]
MPALRPAPASRGERWLRLIARAYPSSALGSACLRRCLGDAALRPTGAPWVCASPRPGRRGDPTARDHLGEALRTSLTRSPEQTLASHLAAPPSPRCAEPPQTPEGAGGHGRCQGLLSSCTVPFRWAPLFKLGGPRPGRCLVPVNATPNTVHTAVTRSHAYPLVLSRKCPRNTTLARVPPPNCPNPCLNHHIKQGTNPQTRSWKGCALERSVQPQGLARPQLRSGPGRWPGMSGRVPLAERALSEGHARRRYRDTSLLIWQQQQRELESVPPGTYLSRSRSMWYSQYGNEAILVRDRNKLEVSRDTGQSRFCSVM